MDIEIHRHEAIFRNVYASAQSIHHHFGIEPGKDGKIRNEPKPREDDISIHEGVRLHQLRPIHFDASRRGLVLSNTIMSHGNRDLLIPIAHNAELSPSGDFISQSIHGERNCVFASNKSSFRLLSHFIFLSRSACNKQPNNLLHHYSVFSLLASLLDSLLASLLASLEFISSNDCLRFRRNGRIGLSVEVLLLLWEVFEEALVQRVLETEEQRAGADTDHHRLPDGHVVEKLHNIDHGSERERELCILFFR